MQTFKDLMYVTVALSVSASEFVRTPSMRGLTKYIKLQDARNDILKEWVRASIQRCAECKLQ